MKGNKMKRESGENKFLRSQRKYERKKVELMEKKRWKWTKEKL